MEKVYILTKDVSAERKFEIKAKKKSAYFLAHPNQGSLSQTALIFLYKMFILLQIDIDGERSQV